MLIQQNNISFTARNPEIRFADDLVRKINKTYPRISSTIVNDFNNIELYRDVEQRIANKIYELRDTQNKLMLNAIISGNNSYVNISKIVTGLTRKFKVGNCMESANLSLLAAKANRLDNVTTAYIKHPNGSDYDHAVVLVNKNSKKPYVIDSWLGFADYVPNAIKRYQNEYRQHFDFAAFPSEVMIVQPDKWNMFCYSLNHNPIEKVSKTLKKMFPELIIKKGP